MHRLGHSHTRKYTNNPRSTYIAPREPGAWLGFRHKGVHAKYRCAKKHKYGHDANGLDEGIVACAPFSGPVNRRYVGKSKL